MNKLFTLLGILTGLTANAQLPATTNQFIPQENYGINYGFENGKSGHVASAGTFAITSTAANVARGGFAASMDFSATGQTLTLASRTIPGGLVANNCIAEAMVKGGDANITMQVYDGSNVIASQALATYATYTKVSIPFICPSSGTMAVRLSSSADAAIVYIDDVFMGANYRVGTVAQAQFVTKGYFASTGSCSWSVSNSAFTSFGTTSACPGPTIEATGPGFSVATTDTDLPKITITSAKPGYYKVHFSANGSNGSQALMALGVSDGTTTISGPTWKASANGATVSYGMFVNATFLKSVAGDLVLEMKGRTDDASSLSIANGTSPQVTSFQVEYFPSNSDTVYAPNMKSAFAGVDIAPGASRAPTHTNTTFTTLNNTNLTAGRTNKGVCLDPTVAGDLGCKISRLPAGKYLINVVSESANNSAAQYRAYETVSGAFTTGGYTNQIGSQGVVPNFGVLEIPYEVTNANIVIQSLREGGSFSGFDITNYPFSLNIIPLEQGIPMPVVLNSVQSSYAGQARMEFYNVVTDCTSSPCTISNQSGGISQVVRVSTGRYDTTFTTAFAVKPACSCSLENGTANVYNLTTTGFRMDKQGNASDAQMSCICIGPK